MIARVTVIMVMMIIPIKKTGQWESCNLPGARGFVYARKWYGFPACLTINAWRGKTQGRQTKKAFGAMPCHCRGLRQLQYCFCSLSFDPVTCFVRIPLKRWKRNVVVLRTQTIRLPLSWWERRASAPTHSDCRAFLLPVQSDIPCYDWPGCVAQANFPF